MHRPISGNPRALLTDIRSLSSRHTLPGRASERLALVEMTKLPRVETAKKSDEPDFWGGMVRQTTRKQNNKSKWMARRKSQILKIPNTLIARGEVQVL